MSMVQYSLQNYTGIAITYPRRGKRLRKPWLLAIRTHIKSRHDPITRHSLLETQVKGQKSTRAYVSTNGRTKMDFNGSRRSCPSTMKSASFVSRAHIITLFRLMKRVISERIQFFKELLFSKIIILFQINYFKFLNLNYYIILEE